MFHTVTHALVIVTLLVSALLISRGSAYVARRLLGWHDRRSSAAAAGLDVKLATLDGEAIHVSHSQIPAVRVLPTGLKELAIELFVSDRDQGERLVYGLQSILPEGPTTFVKRPWIERVEELDETLVRIRMRATVVPGREWLVDGFLSDLLKERAAEGLIVHGPVVLTVDEQTARSFARASAATRWAGRPATQQP